MLIQEAIRHQRRRESEIRASPRPYNLLARHHMSLGWLHHERGGLTDAIASLQEARRPLEDLLKTDPDDPQFQLDLALLRRVGALPGRVEAARGELPPVRPCPGAIQKLARRYPETALTRADSRPRSTTGASSSGSGQEEGGRVLVRTSPCDSASGRGQHAAYRTTSRPSPHPCDQLDPPPGRAEGVGRRRPDPAEAREVWQRLISADPDDLQLKSELGGILNDYAFEVVDKVQPPRTKERCPSIKRPSPCSGPPSTSARGAPVPDLPEPPLQQPRQSALVHEQARRVGGGRGQLPEALAPGCQEARRARPATSPAASPTSANSSRS